MCVWWEDERERADCWPVVYSAETMERAIKQYFLPFFWTRKNIHGTRNSSQTRKRRKIVSMTERWRFKNVIEKKETDRVQSGGTILEKKKKEFSEFLCVHPNFHMNRRQSMTLLHQSNLEMTLLLYFIRSQRQISQQEQFAFIKKWRYCCGGGKDSIYSSQTRLVIVMSN